MLADIMKWTPIPGIGPYEGYDADETLAGGEKLELAGFDDRRHLHARSQHRPPHLLDPRRDRDLQRRRPLPGFGRSRRPARRRLADAGQQPAAARRRPSRRDRRLPGSHGHHHARARDRLEPLPGRPSRGGRVAAARRGQRSTRHRRAPSTCSPPTRLPAPPSTRPRRGGSAPPATAGSRRRCSRTPGCSSAGWGSRPTSSARRCSPSRTRAGARSPCARRERRRSAAPTSSTACTGSRSR